jgi:glycerol uptake facilitator-like aquaporin
MATAPDISKEPANSPATTPLHKFRVERCVTKPDQSDTEYDFRAPLKPTQLLFAGRLGGNQEFIINRNDPAQAALLEKTPDAAPFMSLKETFDLKGFREVDLWKAAFIEGIGTMLLVFLTIWISLSPATAPIPTPTTAAGVFSTTRFLGALVGGVSNFILLSLFIFAFSPVSGGHLNPNITIATFFARLTSFPRMVLYVAFQTIGATLAGLLIRAAYGTRNFVAGGCEIDTALVPVGDAFALEFICDLALLFMSFGVGLDPRQKQVFGPALGPIFVGFVLGIMSFGTSFTRRGYNGVSANPARCFGVFVGSRFPGYHWIHWVGAVTADIVHGLVYFLVPPWQYSKSPTSKVLSTQSSA